MTSLARSSKRRGLGMNSELEIPWHFHKAYLLRVVDGDTIDFTIDVGFRHTTDQRFRLLGLNAPEARGATRDWGLLASDWVSQWIAQYERVEVESHRADSFGRWLGRIYSPTGRSMNDDMIKQGYAVAWDGRGRNPVPWSDGTWTTYPRKDDEA